MATGNEVGQDAQYPTGVYTHKATGEELICIATEKFGNPQAAAAVRVGFEYTGPVTRKEDKEAVAAIPDPNAAPATANSYGVKSVSELEAELSVAKAREAEQKDNKKEADKVNQVAENSVADSNPASETKKGSK